MMLNSLFWRLYLSILGSLVLIAMCFIFFFYYTEHKSEVDDFYRDIKFISQEVLKHWSENNKVDKDVLEQISNYAYFNLFVENSLEQTERISSYTQEARYDNIYIYRHPESGLFLATLKLPDSAQWLSIVDMDIDLDSPDIENHLKQLFEKEIEDESRAGVLFLVLGSSLFVVIGIVLIFQIKRISQYIEKLVDVSKQWADGDLDARAETRIPVPLSQLASELNKMAGDLNQTISEQQVMTHAISHELRTPLSRLQLAASLISRKYPELENEPLNQDLNRYIDDLENLVKQILTFAKLNYTELSSNLEEFDLTVLLTERTAFLIEDEKSKDGGKEIHLEVPTKLQLTADRFDIQIAIDNLLRNALKYCERSIYVRAGVIEDTKRSKRNISLTIEDDGLGIPIDKIDKILMPFARVDESRNRDSGGYGLGLAIVDAIVKRHDGTLTLSQSELGGLKVTFIIQIDRVC